MVFLASRLVIVLTGGTALESRLNYGAAMAVALAAASLVCYVWDRWGRNHFMVRWLAAGGYFATIVLMAAATAGQSVHFALVSQAEAYTFTILAQELSKNPQLHSILVVGTPVRNIGDHDYFGEADGFWLPTVLKKEGYKIEAKVMQTGGHPDLPFVADAIFVWSGEWPNARLTRLKPGSSR